MDSTSSLWDVFDRAAALKLLDRRLGPEWMGRDMQMTYKLLAASIWLARDEAPSAAGRPIAR
jgi:hypothetical protein